MYFDRAELSAEIEEAITEKAREIAGKNQTPLTDDLRHKIADDVTKKHYAEG